MVVNQKEFDQEMEAQKTRSRSVANLETGDWIVIAKDDVEEFIGYDYLASEVKNCQIPKNIGQRKRLVSTGI